MTPKLDREMYNPLLGPTLDTAEISRDLLMPWVKLGVAAVEFSLRSVRTINPISKPFLDPLIDISFATKEMVGRIGAYEKPEWNIPNVSEEIVDARPFVNLVRMTREGDDNEHKENVLLVTPLSGHYATLLRDTVTTLTADHNVLLTDWISASEVPLSAGPRGLDEHTDDVVDFIEKLGPDGHVFAVCQGGIPALVGTSFIAKERPWNQPATLTLMGSPIDSRVGNTVVQNLADSMSIQEFGRDFISEVGMMHPGSGRKVYRGLLQLAAFMTMNPGRHLSQHKQLYQHFIEGDEKSARVITDFYDEYFAVLDMPAEFYLDTVYRVFQEQLLARGKYEYKGQIIDPSAINKTALLTIEGENDDICAPGQTVVAHELCKGIPANRRNHLLQPGVGHYGTFSGRRWRNQIYQIFAAHVQEYAPSAHSSKAA